LRQCSVNAVINLYAYHLLVLRENVMATQHNDQDWGFPLWRPDFSWWTSANTRLHDNFVTFSDAWQAFLGRRVQEDLHLWQGLTAAKTLPAAWTAYSDFWRKAVEDYWSEYATLTKLSAGLAYAKAA
jgi:hypothetical protein